MRCTMLCCVVVVLAALCGCSPESPEPAQPSGAAAGSTNPPATTAQPAPAAEAEIPDVVAMVGERPIPREALEFQLRQQERQRLAQKAMMEQTSGKPMEIQPVSVAMKQNMLDYVVRSTILLVLAEEAGIAATDEEVEARVAEGRARLKDPQSYQDYLNFFKMTEDDLREQLADQITATKYADSVTEACAPSEAEIKAEYDLLAANGQLIGPEEVDFWHVLVSVPIGSDDAAWEEAELKALEALERALGGEDRAAIAKELSDDPNKVRNDGYYEGIRKGVMSPEVEEALWSQPIDEFTTPVKTKYGWDLLQVTARREQGTRDLEFMREKISESLRQRCAQEILAEVVAKATEELPVEVYFSFTEDAPAGAVQ